MAKAYPDTKEATIYRNILEVIRGGIADKGNWVTACVRFVLSC